MCRVFLFASPRTIPICPAEPAGSSSKCLDAISRAASSWSLRSLSWNRSTSRVRFSPSIFWSSGVSRVSRSQTASARANRSVSAACSGARRPSPSRRRSSSRPSSEASRPAGPRRYQSWIVSPVAPPDPEALAHLGQRGAAARLGAEGGGEVEGRGAPRTASHGSRQASRAERSSRAIAAGVGIRRELGDLLPAPLDGAEPFRLRPDPAKRGEERFRIRFPRPRKRRPRASRPRRSSLSTRSRLRRCSRRRSRTRRRAS